MIQAAGEFSGPGLQQRQSSADLAFSQGHFDGAPKGGQFLTLAQGLKGFICFGKAGFELAWVQALGQPFKGLWAFLQGLCQVFHALQLAQEQAADWLGKAHKAGVLGQTDIAMRERGGQTQDIGSVFEIVCCQVCLHVCFFELLQQGGQQQSGIFALGQIGFEIGHNGLTPAGDKPFQVLFVFGTQGHAGQLQALKDQHKICAVTQIYLLKCRFVLQGWAFGFFVVGQYAFANRVAPIMQQGIELQFPFGHIHDLLWEIGVHRVKVFMGPHKLLEQGDQLKVKLLEPWF